MLMLAVLAVALTMTMAISDSISILTDGANVVINTPNAAGTLMVDGIDVKTTLVMLMADNAMLKVGERLLVH